MQAISEYSYVALREDVGLHITPAGARLTGILPEKAELPQQVEPIPVITVNDTARDILCLCTGQYTLWEIVQQLLTQNTARAVDAAAIMQGAIQFLNQMIAYKIVSMYPTAQQRSPRITGSADFFIPQHMSIELTANCNLRCVYCYRDAGPQKAGYIAGDRLVSILEELARYGLRSVELTGGEPLLHPQFSDIFQYCVAHFERVALLSNGCLISQDVAKQLGQHHNKVIVQVDLDGPSPEIHDAIRGVRGAFQRAKAAATRLVAEHVKTRVAMNVTKENLYEIENTLLLAKQIGVKWFTYTPVLRFGRGLDLDLTFTPQQVEYLANLTQRLHEEHGAFFGYLKHDVFLKAFKSEGNCGAGHKVAVLGPSGKVRPCPLLPEEILSFGDLTKQGIPEVFSKPVIAFLHQLKPPDAETCAGCISEAYCRYCHARAITTQSEKTSPCNWVRIRGLADWIPLGQVQADAAGACAVQHSQCS